eukprot:CAMPEP_0197518070 /NCGR_PEP_ID=MMETSP1318-20131121/3188_1 /TAXON_ID=552666 /ORGANISM="Partenskyella glossopodia, Strain RCC365" /LENGTH=154 /DNA_ID=CAMNT_0043068129 /DNA_START=367 /DNA_END=828 /DNA_ORIENTATION=+
MSPTLTPLFFALPSSDTSATTILLSCVSSNTIPSGIPSSYASTVDAASRTSKTALMGCMPSPMLRFSSTDVASVSSTGHPSPESTSQMASRRLRPLSDSHLTRDEIRISGADGGTEEAPDNRKLKNRLGSVEILPSRLRVGALASTGEATAAMW